MADAFSKEIMETWKQKSWILDKLEHLQPDINNDSIGIYILSSLKSTSKKSSKPNKDININIILNLIFHLH